MLCVCVCVCVCVFVCVCVCVFVILWVYMREWKSVWDCVIVYKTNTKVYMFIGEGILHFVLS